MLFLALTTSSAHAELALFSGQQKIFFTKNPVQTAHSEWIHVALESAAATLPMEKWERIVVDHGPGSFTGVRIGLNVARAIAYARKIPIATVSSLTLLLHDAPVSSLALINAFRNQVYMARRDSDDSISPPTAVAVEEAEQMIAQRPAILLGDACRAYSTLAEACAQAGVPLPQIFFPTLAPLCDPRLQSQLTWHQRYTAATPMYVRSSF